MYQNSCKGLNQILSFAILPVPHLKLLQSKKRVKGLFAGRQRDAQAKVEPLHFYHFIPQILGSFSFYLNYFFVQRANLG